MANENITSKPEKSIYSGNAVVLFGDSITNLNNANNGLTAPNNVTTQSILQDNGYFNWFNIYLKNPFTVVRNSGISGQSSLSCLQRIQQDVIAYLPDGGWCSLMVGINDTNQGINADATISNITQMYTQLKQAGIKLMLWTILPNNAANTGSQLAKYNIVRSNAGLIELARNNPGILLMDGWGALYDNATSCGFIAGMASDSTHLNSVGANKLGKFAANTKTGALFLPRPVTAIAADYYIIGTVGTAATANSTINSNVVNFTAGTIVPYVGMYLGFSDTFATFPRGTYVTNVNLTTQVTVSNTAIKTTTGMTMTGYNPYGNLMPNAVMQGTGGATSGASVFTSTPPPSWYLAASGDSANCTVTFSNPARTDNTGGKLWRTVVTWTAAQTGVAVFTHRLLNASVLPPGISPGDTVDIECEINYRNSNLTQTDAVNAGAFEFHITPRDSANVNLTPDAAFNYTGGPTIPTPNFDGIIAIRGFVLPPNTDKLLPQISCRNLAATEGGYALDIGNIVVRKRVPV